MSRTGSENETFIASRLDHRVLEADLRREVRDAEVRFDRTSRALYSTDASNYRQIPIGVVLPKTREAVIATVAVCHRHGAPIVSRGGGTGLTGNSANVAVVIDHSKYRNNIIEINAEERWARVEPGCITDHLRDAAENFHLTYGPDPATHSRNTFGGMIGNNSCGIHSVMAGRTSDNILELEVVTYDGTVMTVGETTPEEQERIVGAGGRQGEIYGALRDLRDRYADRIREKFPDIPRRVSGYNLIDLLPENNFHVARSLVGTEGTCVVILQAKVRLVHSPPVRSLLLLGYRDVFEAGDHIPDILKFGPVGLEGMDDVLVRYMQKKKLHIQDISILPPGKGWLIAEFGGETKEEADGAARTAMDALEKVDNPPSMKLFDDPEEEATVWRVRESGLGATAEVPGEPLMWDGWEDAAVDPRRLGDYLREFRALLDRYGYQTSLYGHFGQGCVHCRISFDLIHAEGLRNWMRFLNEAADLVVKYGGSFSAEHGDGQSKALFLPKMYGEELVEAFRRFKAIWDPDGKMNPGKVVDPYRPDENLKLGVDYNPWQPETHFKFPQDDSSFARATLRCAGVGLCRRPKKAFMCPSFLATREEMHTTRGRARVLFEMFRGDFIADGWKSDEVLETLELCLACTACKTDCPVNVDMSSYKAEFLSHYYEHRLRPRQAYSMGFIGLWGRLGSRMPGLSNWAAEAPLLGTAIKWLAGIDSRRAMPKFASQTFTGTFSNVGQASGEKVVLYPDPFNDCFYPDTLEATGEVLTKWGFTVVLPENKVPALRPLIHYGFLHHAKKKLEKAIAILRPFAREGIPILFLEPSTASVFRHDLPNLLPQHHDGMRVTHLSSLFSEFVHDRNLDLPQMKGTVIFHGHCHQKGVLNIVAARKVIKKMGLEFCEPEESCCGMAGAFGFESGRKYDISQILGERNLFPAVREAGPRTFVVADGFSCRTHVEQGTGTRPMHLAELIRHAMTINREGLP